MLFFSSAALWEIIFRYLISLQILIFLHIFKSIKQYHRGMVSENVEMH